MGNQRSYVEKGLTIQWPKDTQWEIRGSTSKKDRKYNGQKIPNGKSEVVYRKRIDNTMTKRYPMGNQRPYVEKDRQYNGQKIPNGKSEAVYQKRIDNTMTKRYPMGNQRPYIRKG
jgi:hypothetical protein